MTATTAQLTTRRRVQDHAVLRLAATILLTAVASVVVSLALALAVMAASDASGVDVQVPAPGPIPQPSIALPGLDL